MVQVFSTQSAKSTPRAQRAGGERCAVCSRKDLNHPRTAVQGISVVTYDKNTRPGVWEILSNSSHGSVRIVQVLSRWNAIRSIPREARRREKCFGSRKNLNHPRTAVRGIPLSPACFQAGMFLSLRASATDGHHFRLCAILRHQALKTSLSSRGKQFVAVTVPSLPYLRKEILISIPSED